LSEVVATPGPITRLCVVAVTADEKRRMIEHIEYEVIMLLSAAAEFDKRDRGRVMELAIDDPKRTARTAFLEVFLLHARALDEFLSDRRARSDDLWAGDYVGATVWAERSTVPVYKEGRSGGPLRVVDRQRINKLLAHVTTKRMDKDEFPLAAIAGDIHMALGEFVRHETIRDKPEFDRLRALVDDDDRWMLRVLSGGS
jgi:hypothetical protein